MHSILTVTANDIKSLSDEQSRELVALLCKAELIANGQSPANCTWGGNHLAKDGGVDVRSNAPTDTKKGYIPRPFTIFQVKAESFPPSAIPGEMKPASGFRAAIKEAADSGGAYVIVSSRDNCADSALIERVAAMRKCADEEGVSPNLHLAFIDTRQLADWAQLHPGVVAWIKQAIGKPIQGWRPYAAWAYRESSRDSEYFIDEKVKVLLPRRGEHSLATEALDSLRRLLSSSKGCARLVGLSGVGKTRLVQALFDDRITTAASALSPTSALYTDVSDDPDPDPKRMLEELIRDDFSSVLVIDNCSHQLHNKLADLLKTARSSISLITIEHDLRDNEPAGTDCYRIEGSSDDVIERVLRHHYKDLSDLDIDRIVAFSNGNSRVALALAATAEHSGQIAQLKDEELFERLFHQRHVSSDELLRCAEAASLVYSFDAEDDASGSELEALASALGLTIGSLQRGIAELQSRGLVQQRGKWKAVLPHAIANRLAARALAGINRAGWNTTIKSKNRERLALSFSRRLSFLDESSAAKQIAANWLQAGEILDGIPTLGADKLQMLANVAPLNPKAVLEVLQCCAEAGELGSISDGARKSLAELLRHIAYDAELFEGSVGVLVQLAELKSAEGDGVDVMNIIHSLFHLHLSGTHAKPPLRMRVLQSLLTSPAPSVQFIGRGALTACMEARNFSTSYTPEFGALRRDYGWSPTAAEGVVWFELALDAAADAGCSDSAIARDVRGTVAHAIRDLWAAPPLAAKLASLARRFIAIDGWPEGWVGVRNTLKFDKNLLDATALANLRALERQLDPGDLMGRIRTRVLSRGAFSPDLEEDLDDDATLGYERAHIEAHDLGREAGADPSVLADLSLYLHDVSHTNKPYSFGTGVGATIPDVEGLVRRIGAHIQKAGGRVQLGFLTGIIEAWHRRDPQGLGHFLDSAVQDPHWGAMFPSLQMCTPLGDSEYERLTRALQTDLAPDWEFQGLAYGKRSHTLSLKQITSILDSLSGRSDSGPSAALFVLQMVVFGAKDRGDQFRTDLQPYTAEFLRKLDFSKLQLRANHDPHHLESVLVFALRGGDPCKIAKEVLTKLLAPDSGLPAYAISMGSLLKPLFKENPLDSLDVIFALDERRRSRLLYSASDREGAGLLTGIDRQTLLDWCNQSLADRIPFAARACTLFERPNDERGSSNLAISSTAIDLLAASPEKEETLSTFANRIPPNSWSGSRATIIEARASLLDELNPAGDEHLSLLIEAAKTRLMQHAAAEVEREQQDRRRGAQTFE